MVDHEVLDSQLKTDRFPFPRQPSGAHKAGVARPMLAQHVRERCKILRWKSLPGTKEVEAKRSFCGPRAHPEAVPASK